MKLILETPDSIDMGKSNTSYILINRWKRYRHAPQTQFIEVLGKKLITDRIEPVADCKSYGDFHYVFKREYHTTWSLASSGGGGGGGGTRYVVYSSGPIILGNQ